MRKFAFLLALCSGPLALANVSVSAPANGSSVATTVQYVASATTSCPAGVSAIGIYSAPGALAYSTPGSRLNTELYLNPGTYKTVVQAWDNLRWQQQHSGHHLRFWDRRWASNRERPAGQQHGEFDGAVFGVGEFLLHQRHRRHGNLHGVRRARIHHERCPDQYAA